MNDLTPTVELLRTLPRSERRDALETLTVAEFKSTLLMADDEYLPMDESYFQLGFTSLRIVEVKQRLETLLGAPVSTNVLFNSPTIDQLMDHLLSEVIEPMLDGSAAPAATF